MDVIIALTLAVVQGLTEFLPVSSSGHLRLFAEWFGLSEPQTLFDVVLHGGTLGAVLVVYREPLGAIVRALMRWMRQPTNPPRDEYAKLGALICVGSIPTGVLGLALGPYFEAHVSSVLAVGVLLLVNGLVLGSTRRLDIGEGRGVAELTARDVLIIGVVQGLAVLRGISRSGSTIACGLWLGLRRDTAALVSFLLSIPAVLGALLLLVADASRGDEPLTATLGVFALGAVVSFLTGWIALRWLLRLVQAGGFHRFAPYCWALGLGALVWSIVAQ